MNEQEARAAALYEPLGKWAYGFAKGKISGDPVYRYVLNLIGETGVLVDVGCGEGYLLALVREIYPKVELFGLDHDERRLSQAKSVIPGINLISQDLRKAGLPLADVITCLDVLHYMPENQQDEVLAELAQATKEKGVVLIRDGVSDMGFRSLLTTFSEKITMAIGRHKGDGVFFRPTIATSESLQKLGFKVEIISCNEGTPFANVLFVARRG